MTQTCAKAQVSELISVSRLGKPSTETSTCLDRKEADLQFIKICQDYENAGDVLCALALDPMETVGVRFNAALALEPLFALEHQKSQKHFVDKATVVSALTEFVATNSCMEPSFMQGKISDTLCRCLAVATVYGYPGEQSGEIVRSAVQQAQAGDVRLASLLEMIAVHAGENAALWQTLANDFARRFIGDCDTAREALLHCTGDEDGLQQQRDCARLYGLRTLLRLMQKRPRPSQLQGCMSAKDVTLFSTEMRLFVVDRQLRDCVALAPLRSQGDRAAEHFEECGVTLEIAQRLTQSPEACRVVFESSAFFITSCCAAYENTSVPLSAVVLQLVEQSLDSLLSVLQSSPETAQHVEASALLMTLFTFMLPRGANGDDAGSEDEFMFLESTLTDSIVNDEVIPIGCSSGSIPASAAAVLELYLDNSPEQSPSAVCALCEVMKPLVAAEASGSNACDTDSAATFARWCAAACMLRSISRVYSSSEHSIFDSLPATESSVLADGCASALLALAATAPKRTMQDHKAGHRTEVVAALLLEAFAGCFEGCRLTGTCTALAALMQQLMPLAERQTETSAAGGPLGWVVLYTLSKLVTDTAVADRHQLVNAIASVQWLAKGVYAMKVRGAGLLPLFCGAAIVCAVLGAAAEEYPAAVAARQSLLEDANGPTLLSEALENIAEQISTRSGTELLTRLLCLCAVHPAQPQDAMRCKLSTLVRPTLVSVGEALSSFRVGNTERLDLVLRALSSFCCLLARDTLAGRCCQECSLSLLWQTLPLLCAGAKQSVVLLDEGGSRARTNALASSCLALRAVLEGDTTAAEAVLASTIAVAAGAQQQRLAPRVTSSCVGGVALEIVALPQLLVTHENALFSLLANTLAQCAPPPSSQGLSFQGLDHLGECLLFAALTLRRSQLVAHLLLSGAPDADAPSATALAALGWSSSLVVFADDFTVSYILTSFACLLLSVSASCPSPEAQYSALARQSPHLRMWYFPSLLVKKVPSSSCIECPSVAAAIAFAAASLRLRRQRASKVSLFDQGVASTLMADFAAESCLDAFTRSKVPVCASADGFAQSVEWIVSQLTALGHGQTVHEVFEYVTKSTTMK